MWLRFSIPLNDRLTWGTLQPSIRAQPPNNEQVYGFLADVTGVYIRDKFNTAKIWSITLKYNMAHCATATCELIFYVATAPRRLHYRHFYFNVKILSDFMSCELVSTHQIISCLKARWISTDSELWGPTGGNVYGAAWPSAHNQDM